MDQLGDLGAKFAMCWGVFAMAFAMGGALYFAFEVEIFEIVEKLARRDKAGLSGDDS